MIIVESIKEAKEIIREKKRRGLKIGFVPTMGCLHLGHISLIEKARKLSDYVVVSIFVNPTQFGPNEDYDKYPRTFEQDKIMCEIHNVSMIFHPSVQEMYPQNFSTFVEVTGQISQVLCGAKREGHFRGVATVVSKLFNIVEPDVAIFGQKDAQQAFIIKKMVKELDFPIEIVVSETVREEDGLAMSSRNNYLSKEERAIAPLIKKALDEAEEAFKKGETKAEILKKKVEQIINSSPLFKIDYVEIVDTENFNPVDEVSSESLLAVAAFLGKTRLIDNLILKK
ncbi:MAG: pantoate--beta-alanine ligase [Acidobacteriota bacterium]|nr:pantoate--beta-alanine ligase [Thermoanaerobaculaceae bacterium]